MTSESTARGEAPANGTARPSRSPHVQFDDVGYAYPTGALALSKVDLSIDRGEIISVIGPSGCGKSTLLSLIAKLAVPSRGSVVWPGDSADKKRRLSLVFQKDTLLPWLTVRENVSFGLRYLDISAAEGRQRVDEMLAMIGLEPYADRRPGQLSGGQRRRVAILMGVVPMPDVLLLDEPFSALDEPTRVGVHEDLYRIVKEKQMTTVLVTHDIAEAVTLSDRVALMSRSPGRIVSVRDIPLGENRNIQLIRESTDFQHLSGELWHDLRLQMTGASR